ncbi:hypothetical protein ANCCAN_18056 [Ancylostoma caninum]|uniref:Uncharacterized protein n=1 Tax=Ancylostoma caninum TaxID=29170 RepID=A0A368G0G0_ANCCA|nr:hypothetical protein ANCCAN_18056 [Ancylostoma caninum]
MASSRLQMATLSCYRSTPHTRYHDMIAKCLSDKVFWRSPTRTKCRHCVMAKEFCTCAVSMRFLHARF